MSERKFFPWFVWGVAVSFLAFQFILRLLPGLIMPQIMVKFHVNALDYGLLSSMYYFGYAGAQIPVAFLLDRFGPKKVISGCVFLCSICTLVLAHTVSWPVMLMGRFLIGVGSAAGFLGTAKVVSQWFSADRYARMLGFTFTFGLMGAVYGGKPVATWIASSSWESVMNSLAGIGVLVALGSFVFLKNTGPFVTNQTLPTRADFKALFTNKNIILLGICNLLMVGTLEGLADVWGVPYLVKAHGIEKENAAFFTSLIFVGMLCGGPILAFLAEKSKRFFDLAALCGALSALLVLVLLFAYRTHSPLALFILMFAIGILCCYQVLILTIGAQFAPKSMLGIATAFLNCVNMVGGSFFHGTIGLVLNFSVAPILENGLRAYSADQYRTALLVIPIASLLGSVGLLVAKRKMVSKEVAA